MIRIDPQNPRAIALGESLAGLLGQGALADDLVVVIGGDGWMLSCILLNDVPTPDALAAAAGALLKRRYKPWVFPRLAMFAARPDSEDTSAEAINDVYVERSSGHTAHLRLSIDGTREAR